MQHLYQGAEALKIPTSQRKNWGTYRLHLLEVGPVTTVIDKLRQHGVKRIDQERQSSRAFSE